MSVGTEILVGALTDVAGLNETESVMLDAALLLLVRSAASGVCSTEEGDTE